MAGRSGLNWPAGGVAAATLVPVLALGPGLPFWIACIASAMAGAGLVVLLAPATRFKTLDASGVAPGQDRVRARTPHRSRPSCRSFGGGSQGDPGQDGR